MVKVNLWEGYGVGNQHTVFSSTCLIVIQVKTKLLALLYINTGSTVKPFKDVTISSVSKLPVFRSSKQTLSLSPTGALKEHRDASSSTQNLPSDQLKQNTGTQHTKPTTQIERKEWGTVLSAAGIHCSTPGFLYILHLTHCYCVFSDH